MAVTEPVSIELRCPHCSRVLMVQFSAWGADSTVRDMVVRCPACTHEHTAGIPARLIRVTAQTL